MCCYQLLGFGISFPLIFKICIVQQNELGFQTGSRVSSSSALGQVCASPVLVPNVRVPAKVPFNVTVRCFGTKDVARGQAELGVSENPVESETAKTTRDLDHQNAPRKPRRRLGNSPGQNTGSGIINEPPQCSMVKNRDDLKRP